MYKILQSDSLMNEEQLNDLYAEGWQLVTIVHAPRPQGALFYFYFTKI